MCASACTAKFVTQKCCTVFINFLLISLQSFHFLGTGKLLIKIWLKTGTITEEQLKRIDNLQQHIQVPHGQTKLPRKISKYYKRLKAEECKAFVLVYSLYCCKRLLGRRKYQNLYKYVRACKVLCQKSITIDEVTQAHNVLPSRSFQ